MDVASILIIAVCGAIGIYIRYEARESRRPWLVTVVLAAVFLAFSLLKPPGQELLAILRGAAGGLAAGAPPWGYKSRSGKRTKKRPPLPHGTRALFSQLYFTTTFSAPRVSRASWSRAS